MVELRDEETKVVTTEVALETVAVEKVVAKYDVVEANVLVEVGLEVDALAEPPC